MHELAITDAIVSGIRERVGDVRVTRVILELGQLSGVVAESVRFFFEICTQGSPLEGATLEIVERPGRGRCRACGVEAPLPEYVLACACGSFDVEVLQGQELKVHAVEVI